MNIRYERVSTLQGVLLMAIGAVYVDCFEKSEWNEKWKLKEAMEVFLTAFRMAADVFLAFDDELGYAVGFAIGFPVTQVKSEDGLRLVNEAGVDPGAYYISDIGVMEGYRQHHVGRKLVEELFEAARHRGHRSCTTRTMVGCKGEILFQRCGFVINRTLKFITGGRESERYVFTRSL